MSDLHCPARVFVARHGEADYETDLVTNDGGSLTAAGRRQAAALAQSLHAERVARVWCSPMSRAVQTAEIVAAILGLDVVVREGLREYGVGSLAGTSGDEAAVIGVVLDAWLAGDDEAAIDGGEPIADIARRVTRVLVDVADRHRGEAVLVVTHGGAIMATLPRLVGLRGAEAREMVLPCGGHIGLEHDSDGWRLRAESPGHR